MSYIQRILYRSLPNPKRPKLDAERENDLYDLEVRSAVCYTELEFIANKWDELAKSLDKTVSAVPCAIEEEDSMVYHVNEAKVK